VDRREFLTVVGAAATLPAHEWLIKRDEAIVGQTAGARLTEEAVDGLDRMVGHLRSLEEQLGREQVLTLARAQLKQVEDSLRNRSYTEAVGRRLYATAAESLRFCGWLSCENGRPGHAQRYWNTALRAAHASGDRAIGSNILAFMSDQAWDLGQIRDAVTLAETAHAGYRGGSPRIAARLSLQAALAYSAAGESTACQRALDAAFNQVGSFRTEPGPDWVHWLDEAQSHLYAGTCYLRLQLWDLARHHFDQALKMPDSYVSTSPNETAWALTRLAAVCVRQDHPDIEQAVDLARNACELLEGGLGSMSQFGTAPTVRELVSDLAAHDQEQDVQDLVRRMNRLPGIAA